MIPVSAHGRVAGLRSVQVGSALGSQDVLTLSVGLDEPQFLVPCDVPARHSRGYYIKFMNIM